jgi:hypothetical protein
MLSEVAKTKQVDGEPVKRWFTSDNMDLFVWLDDENNILNYQLTYDKERNEKALTWDKTEGFKHLVVENSERSCKYPQSPLLKVGGTLDLQKLLTHFDAYSQTLYSEIKSFIISRIKYNPLYSP